MKQEELFFGWHERPVLQEIGPHVYTTILGKFIYMRQSVVHNVSAKPHL